jgi:ATP-dependent exoDNAse (exonuclease V) beta subunit
MRFQIGLQRSKVQRKRRGPEINRDNHKMQSLLAPPHERDGDIEFDEPLHKYTILGATDFTSVTTFIGKLFEHFDADAVIAKMMNGKNWPKSKYFGMSADAIKKQWADAGTVAAAEGTKMHADIENYYKCEPFENGSLEFKQFLQFATEFGLRPYRSEWRVYNEEIKIVGTIDMVFEHPDGTVSIYDWKRSKKLERYDSWGKRAKHPALKHIPDTNYWHYALQLNLYQYILETKYKLRVIDRVLICCHPERSEFEAAPVPNLQHEIQVLLATPEGWKDTSSNNDLEPLEEPFLPGHF